MTRRRGANSVDETRSESYDRGMSSVIAFPERPGDDGLVSQVAANIRVACARRGWKQSDLAQALRVSKGTVSIRWMGARQWQLEELEAVAKALNVSVQSLLEYTARDSNPEPADYDRDEGSTVYSFAAAAMARACGAVGRRFEVAS